MNRFISHWGNISTGSHSEKQRIPLRSLFDLEIADSRTFSQALFREFTKAGRRRVATKLIEESTNYPWPKRESGR